jgi:hypothetical protein
VHEANATALTAFHVVDHGDRSFGWVVLALPSQTHDLACITLHNQGTWRADNQSAELVSDYSCRQRKSAFPDEQFCPHACRTGTTWIPRSCHQLELTRYDTKKSMWSKSSVRYNRPKVPLQSKMIKCTSEISEPLHRWLLLDRPELAISDANEQKIRLLQWVQKANDLSVADINWVVWFDCLMGKDILFINQGTREMVARTITYMSEE